MKKPIKVTIIVLATCVVAFFAISFYGMSITPSYDINGGAETLDALSDGEDINGKVVKLQVSSIDVGNEGLVGYSEKGAENVVFIPREQEKIAKVGDTLYLEVASTATLFGYTIISGTIVD